MRNESKEFSLSVDLDLEHSWKPTILVKHNVFHLLLNQEDMEQKQPLEVIRCWNSKESFKPEYAWYFIVPTYYVF